MEVQKAAAEMIVKWARLYGTDARLREFALAGLRLQVPFWSAMCGTCWTTRLVHRAETEAHDLNRKLRLMTCTGTEAYDLYGTDARLREFALAGVRLQV